MATSTALKVEQWNKISDLRQQQIALIDGLNNIAPTQGQRISAAKKMLDSVMDKLFEEWITAAVFDSAEAKQSLPPETQIELMNTAVAAFDQAKKSVLDMARARKSGQPVPQELHVNASSASRVSQGGKDEGELVVDSIARQTEPSRPTKRGASIALAEAHIKPSQESGIEPSSNIQENQRQTEPFGHTSSPIGASQKRSPSGVKPSSRSIAPLRRPTRTDAWYSHWTATDDAWAQRSSARKRELSHIGYIEETEAGMLAPTPCRCCARLRRPNPSNGNKPEKMACMIYRPETVTSFTQIEAPGCSSCWSVARTCSFAVDEMLKLRDAERARNAAVDEEIGPQLGEEALASRGQVLLDVSPNVTSKGYWSERLSHELVSECNERLSQSSVPSKRPACQRELIDLDGNPRDDVSVTYGKKARLEIKPDEAQARSKTANSQSPPVTTKTKATRPGSIAPLRRPTRTDAWFSYLVPNEAAFVRLNPSRQRQLSHVGYITETVAGMRPKRPCASCQNLNRRNPKTGQT